MTTILPRSFFPINEFVKKVLPDTALMRDWWARVYNEEISNSACHVLIAKDKATQAVVGVLPMRMIGAENVAGGFWQKHTWTVDHGSEWGPPIECQSYYEKQIMGNEEHLLIELLAVDYDYRSVGIGKALVKQACQIADDSNRSIFVQSGSAKGFYLGLDNSFHVEAEPDWDGYKPCLMSRKPIRKQSS